MNINNKLLFTVKNFKKTAYHYYGDTPFSLIRFVYYSLFRVNTFLVFENDLKKQIRQIEVGPKIRLMVPTLDELDELRRGKDLPREFFCDKLHNAKRCWVALYEGEIAYVHWMYFRGDYSRFLILNDDVCELNHIATMPRFRGNYISSQMLANVSMFLQGVGYSKVVMVVHQNNVAMIKNLSRSDFKQVRRIRSLGPFNGKVKM